MERLLIVDDEIGIVNTLYGVFSERFDFEIHRAASGKEAIDIVNRFSFDFAVIDICMPQVSGFDVLEYLKQMWPQCSVLMLTAFERFDYAYRVAKYDDVHFLLKHESYTTICDTIDNERKRLQEKRAQERKAEEISANMEHIKESVKEYILRRTIKFGMQLPNSEERLSLNIDLNDESVLLIGCTLNGSGDLNAEDQKLIRNLQMTACSHLSVFGLHFYSFVSDNVMVFLAQTDHSFVSYRELSLQIHSAFENLLEEVTHIYHLAMNIVCSDRFLPWGELHMEYKMICASLAKHEPGSGVLRLGMPGFQEQDVKCFAQKFPGVEDMNILWGFILQRDALSFLLYLRNGFKSWVENPLPMNENINISVNAVAFLMLNALELFIQYCDDKSFIHKLSVAYNYRDTAQWVTELLDASRKLFDLIEAESKNNQSWLIQKVDRYIAEHYQEDISLTTIAEMFHYNPSYLSRVYKSSTGNNLVYAIRDIRIAAAKEMLKFSSKRIPDISQEVGFVSAKYFSQVFKRVMGCSPNEYREANRKNR